MNMDYLVGIYANRVLQRALGNYTKSYESFKRIENIERLFREVIRKDKKYKVLDVGCGDGYHICLLNTIAGVKDKASFTAIDLSENEVKFASHIAKYFGFDNMSFQVGFAEKLEFPDNIYDVVLCSDVVEHLEFPEKCFAEIFRVLKPGGATIITTPNETSIARRISDKIRPKKRVAEVEQRGHISVYGLKKWLDIARRTEFIVSEVRRGALIFGGHKYNRHPVLFAFVILMDKILDYIPFAKNWGEAITMKLFKPDK